MASNKHIADTKLLLERLKNSENLERVFKNMKKSEIKNMVELFYNLSENRIPLYKYEVTKLGKKWRDIIEIGRQRSYKRAKKSLVQKGAGILPLVINAALALLSSLE